MRSSWFNKSISVNKWKSFLYFLTFLKLKYSWFTMLCQFLLYSKVTQLYTHTHICTHSFSHIIFHHVLSQEIGYSSLCCTVGPCSSSILPVHPSPASHPPSSLFKEFTHFQNPEITYFEKITKAIQRLRLGKNLIFTYAWAGCEMS